MSEQIETMSKELLISRRNGFFDVEDSVIPGR